MLGRGPFRPGALVARIVIATLVACALLGMPGVVELTQSPMAEVSGGETRG